MSWLNEDFSKSADREYFLKECQSSKKLIPAGSILQVSQCLNISVPRRNREVDTSTQSKNSVLKVTLTDGKNSIHGLLTEYHPKLTNSTVPGTKVEITADAPIVANFVLLTSKNTRVLGGNVPSLAEQWEMQLTAEKMKGWGIRIISQTGDGPPPWKPFNFRERVDRSELRGVKAMDLIKEQQKDTKSDEANKSKFDAQRQETISELAKKAQAKSFGEGKRLMDKGVLDIMNEGFTQEQAEEAMQRFKNPQKALKHLKGNRSKGEVTSTAESSTRISKKGRNRDMEEDENGPTGNERGEQPSSNISLFGFIQGKIKGGDATPANTADESQPSTDSQHRGGGSGGFVPRDSESDQRDSRSFRGRGRPDRGRSYGMQRPSQDVREFPSNDDRRSSQFRGGRGRGGQQNDRRGRDHGGHYDSGPPDGNRRQMEPRFSRNDRPPQTRQEYGRTQNPGQGHYGSPQLPPTNPDFQAGFVNQASHFPSLGASDFTPRSAPPPQRAPYQQPQRGYDDSNFHSRNNGNDRQSYRQHDGQQTYPGRGSRGYDGYERMNGRRNDGYNNYGESHGHVQYQDPPHDQFAHHFSKMSVQGNTLEQFSGDWRPSKTMVFTRTRGRGGPN